MGKHAIAASFSMSCNELLNTVHVSQYQGQGTDMWATEEALQPGVFITILSYHCKATLLDTFSLYYISYILCIYIIYYTHIKYIL